MPFINQSKPGDQLFGWMLRHNMRQAGLRAIARYAKFPELCYNNLSINDMALGYSFAQVQAFEVQQVAMLRGLGCKFVFTDTTDPDTVASGGGTALAWGEISSGGTGYGANSTFNVTVAGGTFTSAATVNVSTNASGVVTEVNSVTPGQYSANPTSTNSCAANKCLGALPTGGSGTGLTMILYMTNFTPTATQAAQPAMAAALLRNAQLRLPNEGSYANLYDGVIDWAGIDEVSAGSGTWVPYGSVDGLHADPMQIIAKAAYAAPIIAAWAKTAAAR